MSQSGKAVRVIIVLLFTVKILVGGCGDDGAAGPDSDDGEAVLVVSPDQVVEAASPG